MKLIVDRIEDGIAVCEKEDLTRVEISASDLPENCREGSALRVLEDGKIILDTETENERRKKLFNLTKMLIKDGEQ